MIIRNILNIFAATILGLALFSCGGNSENGTKFAPKEKKSTMSEADRKAAIDERKKALTVDVASMMNSTGVKLTVLPPAPQGEITEEVSALIGTRMMNIIAANGIGGVNNVPDFALAATISETGRQTTSTAPQKYIVKYDVNFQVLNVNDGNVYGSATESVSGVGNSFAEATRNAVDQIKSTPQLQQLLSSSSEKIISWYNDNLPTLKNQVAAAMSENNYALALSYLSGVPSQATAAYSYASQEQPKVLDKYKKHNAATNMAALKGAIAAGQQSADLNQDVYNYLARIPSGTPEYAQAQKLVEIYQSEVLKRQAEKEARQYKEDEAKRIQAEKMELAKLDADRQIALAEAKASEQAMRLHMREKDDSKRGFWGNLGARIISGLDYVGDKVSGNGE